MARTTAESIRADGAAADLALKELLTPPPAAAAPAAAPAANDIPPAAPAEPVAAAPAAPAPAAPAPTPAPAPSVTPVDPNAVAQMQQRLSSLEGMFNRTVADLTTEKARTATLERIVAQRAQLPTAPAAPAPPQPLITAEDRKEFGEDFIDLCTRVARQQFEPLVQSLVARVARLEQGVQTTQRTVAQVTERVEETAQDKFFGKMFQLVPDWESLNVDKIFLDWLQKPDIYTGTVKQELLQQALAKWDAERVAAFFTAFKNESGTATPATPPAQSAPAPAPAPAAPPQPAPVDPRQFISPSSAAPASVSPNPPGGKIWSTADVNGLYDGLMKGKISREDFNVQEAALMQAVREGRLRE